MPRGVYSRKPLQPEPEIHATCEDVPAPTVSAAVEPSAPAPTDRVVFVSREKEPVQFYIRGNKGVRLNDGRVAWDFDQVEGALVRRGDLAVRGRIVEQ